jgi:hypothetical protein
MRHNLCLGATTFEPMSLDNIAELTDPLEFKIRDAWDLWIQNRGVNRTESILAKLMHVQEYGQKSFYSKYTKKGSAKTDILTIGKHFGRPEQGGKNGLAYRDFEGASYLGYDWSALTKKRKKTGKKLEQRKTHGGLESFYGAYTY